MKALAIGMISLFVFSGCASVKEGYATVPIAFGLFRLPVTIDLGRPNKPLPEEERCMLKQITNEINKGVSREEAVKKMWHGNEACSRKDNDSRSNPNYFDILDDPPKDTLVFVAISGGGARAASLGAHTLSLLEMKYNELTRRFEGAQLPPMVKLVDAYSTVSGGSIYAYEIATTRSILDRATRSDRKESSDNNPSEVSQSSKWGTVVQGKCNFDSPLSKALAEQVKYFEQEFYYNLMNLSMVRDVGFWSSLWYLSPGNLFLGPLVTLTTNWDYQSILAGGLNAAYQVDIVNYKSKKHIALLTELDRLGFNRAYVDLYRPHKFTLGQLCPKPRFYFNSTSLETGLPFVFTQSVVHAPGDLDPAGSQSVRLDLVDLIAKQNERHSKKVLADATTLEEINSSPAEFPLASAVMASAAFPIGISPLELSKYGYDPDKESLYETAENLHVSDGGIFDNSGLTTISNLALHLCNSGKCATAERRKKIILLAINAEGDEYDRFYPNKKAEPESWFNTIPPFKYFDLPIFPIRTAALGAKPLGVVHFSNKRRAEEIAIRQLKELDGKQQIEFYYFPVSFSQMSSFEQFPVADSSNLFERLRSVPTNYTLTSDNDTLISEASEVLVTGVQKVGWKIGPRCSEVKRLDEAFAFTLIRAAGSSYLLDNNDAKDSKASWCKESGSH